MQSVHVVQDLKSLVSRDRLDNCVQFVPTYHSGNCLEQLDLCIWRRFDSCSVSHSLVAALWI